MLLFIVKIILILIPVLLSKHIIPQHYVSIGGESFPAERGTFYAYLVYPEKVVLQGYPAVFRPNSEKPFADGTPIMNSENHLIGHIIGEHLGYYPITPSRFDEKLYCGRYDLEEIVYGKKLFYNNQQFNSTEVMLERAGMPLTVQSLFKDICFIYKDSE